MTGNRIKVSSINDHIWLLNDNNEATGYVIAGSERALIIDTMNGYEDVAAIAKSITALPLTVVNTHGHPDHIYGNIFFEEAYINPGDMALAAHHYAQPPFFDIMQKTGKKPATFLPVQEGDTFDLGGLVLEVYELAGHTPGGIVLLDRKDRILFTGDSIIEQCWMQMEESLPMDIFAASLRKIEGFRDAFDYILSGHAQGLIGAEIVEAQRCAVEEVAAGKCEGDEPYHWFDGCCMAHPFQNNAARKIVYKIWKELQIDRKNYDPDAEANGSVYHRVACRGIICQNGKYLMIRSKYGDYKFPGGGWEKGENYLQTLFREVQEETGYHVIADSIRDAYFVTEKRKGDPEALLIMKNLYFYCDVEIQAGNRNLDEYEKEYEYEVIWTDLQAAVQGNEKLAENTLTPWAAREEMIMRDLMEKPING